MVVPGGARLRDGLSHGVGIAIGRDAQSRCVVTRVLPGGAAAFSGQVGPRNPWRARSACVPACGDAQAVAEACRRYAAC